MDQYEIEKLAVRLRATFLIANGWRTRRAARRLAAVNSPAASRVLGEVFVQNVDRQATEIAEQALVGLQNQARINAVCDVVIATGDERLAGLLAQAGHTPSDPGRRAVLLFLADEFERYAELDFDGSLLRAAHDAANEDMRRKLAAKARAAGRVDWVQSVAGQRHRIAELSDGEWETVVGVLVSAARWEELWRLAVEAPTLWGVRMLQALDEHGWKPASEAERVGYAELILLAVACSEIPTEHTPGKATVLHGHSEGVECLAVTPDSGLLASAGRDRRLRLWQLPSGAPVNTLWGFGENVTSMVMTPDSELLASSGSDFYGKVRLWRLPTGAPAGTLEVDPSVSDCLAVTPDGCLLASGSGSDVQLWRLPAGTPAGTLKGHGSWVKSLAVTPNGELLASGDIRGVIRLWRLPSGVPVGTFKGHRKCITALAVTPDGGLLASTSDWAGRTVRLWRLPSGELASTLKGHRKSVRRLVVTPDGGLLASGSWDGTVRLWRLPSGTLASTIDVGWDGADCFAVTPDGGLLCSGSTQDVRLWRLPSGMPAGVAEGNTSRNNYSFVRCVAVTPDGGLLVGGFHDGAVRLWPMWLNLLHKPIGQVTSADLELLRSLDGLPALEQAWIKLIMALVRHRHRHDVEIADAVSVVEAGGWDIELDG